MPYNLAPSPVCYPFKMINFIRNGSIEQPANETLVHVLTMC